MSLLSQQLQTFRLKHGIPEGQTAKRKPAPSVLFGPREASQLDADAVAAIAMRGLRGLSGLDPDLAAFSPLFEGAPRDRELLTQEENARLDGEIRRMLLLLSPHLQTTAAQECLEGLLHRYHIHRWNVDDVMASVLPHHDSPLFTRLLQGLHVLGKPKWSWLEKPKKDTATLGRAALAKYCTKDIAVLAFVGDVVQETLKLQKANRALMTFFMSTWLATLASVGSMTSNLVEAALPAVLAMLRKPHLRDSFHAGLGVAGALCVKAELHSEVRAQLMERVAKQPGRAGELQRPAAALLALMLQAQSSDGLPEKALGALSAAGPQVFASALPAGLDCGNLLGAVVEACLLRAASALAEDASGEQLVALAGGVLANHALVDRYAPVLCSAVVQAFVKASSKGAGGAGAGSRAAAVCKGPVAALGERQPAALSAAFRQAVGAALESGVDTGPLVKLLSPVVPSVGAESDGELLPVIQGFEHQSAKVRAEAVKSAAASLEQSGAEGDAPRERLLASLILEAVHDRSADVAQAALGLKGFWQSSPHADAAKAVPVLVGRLSKLLSGATAKGSSVQEMFASLFPAEAKVTVLAPAIIRTLSRMYIREDCGEDTRKALDRAVLPIALLCLVCKDSKECAAQSAALWSAALAIAKVGGHSLLAGLKEAAAAKSEDLLSASCANADAATIDDLCFLVEARPLQSSGSPAAIAVMDAAGPSLLGGAAAQSAAAAALAATLRGPGDEDGQRCLQRSAEACARLALHHRLAPEGGGRCPESLRDLVRALLARATPAASKPASRRNSGAKKAGAADAAGKGGARATIQAMLRVMLDQPRCLSAELGSSIRGPRAALARPALLRLALGPEPPATAGPGGIGGDAGAANALNLLRSLLLSAKASEWPADQTLALALTSRVARAQTPEVRAAAYGALEALQNAEWSGDGGSCWESECALALREAGVLRPPEEVLPRQAWDAAGSELEIAGLAQETMTSFIEHVVAHRGEVLQDSSGAPLALSKLLSSKKGGLGKGARQKACNFWAVGLSMLSQPRDDVQPLMSAVPSTSMLGGLQELLQKCAEQAGSSMTAPELLFTATSCVHRLAQAEGEGTKKAASGEVVATAVEHVLTPFLSAVSDTYEGGGRVSCDQVAELSGEMCRCLAAASSRGIAEEACAKGMAAVFRLCSAASSAPPLAEEDAAQAAPTARVVAASQASLAEASLNARFLHQVGSTSAAFKGKQLCGPRGRAAAELLSRQVVTLGAGAGGGRLLAELSRLAQEAAAQQAKQAAKGAAAPEGDTVSSLLAALAALSEHLGAGARDAGVDVGAACSAISNVCDTLGSALTARMLAAAIRACGGLAQLAAPGDEGPLRACAGALRRFQGPLDSAPLAVLRSSLRRLWSPSGVAEPVDDAVAQRGLRTLLHAAVAQRSGLTPETDRPMLLELSRSAGLGASLDFALLLLAARRGAAAPAAATKRKSGSRKRRAATEQDEAMEEEVLGAAVQLGGADAAADEALEMLSTAGSKARYQCVATLAQTLCALAAEVRRTRQQKDSGVGWGRGLLPPELLEGAGAEKAPWLLEVGLAVLGRFVSQHGLPDDLDEQDPPNADALRATAFREDSEADEASAGAAISYVTWCVCTTEVLLGPEGDKSDGLSACRSSTRESLSLLMRSLAVNHTLTFFRAVCLVLQVPDFSPPLKKGDVLAESEIILAVSARIMSAASVALKDRREMRGGDSAEGMDLEDEESWAAHGDVCVAAARHVAGRFLGAGGKARKGVRAETLEVAWKFLDSLCLFSGKLAPKPVLDLCLPAAADCLGGFAPDAATGQPAPSVASACCTYIRTAVEQLGRGILPKLGVITSPLLHTVSSLAAVEDDEGVQTLEEVAASSLKSLVSSVGPFLEPYLDRIIGLFTKLNATTSRAPLLDGLGRELVASTPQRHLMPALSKAVGAAAALVASSDDTAGSLAEPQRVAALLVWQLSASQPDAVVPEVDSICDTLLRLVAVGPSAAHKAMDSGSSPEDMASVLFPRGAKKQPLPLPPDADTLSCSYCGTGGGARRLFDLASAAYTQFALRLDVDALRPCFTKAISWARGSQETAMLRQADKKAVKHSTPNTVADADDASRALALFSIMHALVVEAPGVAEDLLLPLVYKDVIACLGASRLCAQKLAATHKPAGAKRRAGGAAANKVLQNHTWWWFEVSTAALGFIATGLLESGERTDAAQAVDEAIEELVEPCCNMLDIFSLLPALEDTPVSQQLLQGLQGALVSLAAASDADGLKALIREVLRKSSDRDADDAETRLCAVKSCHKIWEKLGAQCVTSLTEVVATASELVEDEDPRVEEATRALIKTMEDCTGESLQESLKA